MFVVWICKCSSGEEKGYNRFSLSPHKLKLFYYARLELLLWLLLLFLAFFL